MAITGAYNSQSIWLYLAYTALLVRLCFNIVFLLKFRNSRFKNSSHCCLNFLFTKRSFNRFYMAGCHYF